MEFEQILSETRDRVGIIRLNRPAKLNAWTARMSQEIHDQIAAWNDDPAIGAIVITGEGRAFCAGADIGGFAERAERNRQGAGERWTAGGYSFTNFLRSSKPTVAAINGYAAGVGLTMALPCDIRIASDTAQLSIRFIKMGLMPELGSTRLLAQIVGLGHATDMCLTGRFVPADEALRMGLVSQVVTADQLLDTAVAKADEIANNPTGAVMMIKQLLAKNPLDPDLDAVMEREQVRDQLARRLPDHQEAITAFRERRPARFNRVEV
ncbi:MAG: enoyl-CoA hydratase/isomerase family protein [Chloroflexi bacterium]|nr:enoyl-CoA hydratase/isomerase family protein [Chloroflexota bacterium]